MPDDELLNGYDARLGMTQQLPAYRSEQQIFKLENEGQAFIIPVNFLSSESRTILPAQPELTVQHQQQYQGVPQGQARLFILGKDGSKLAEVPYTAFLESLTDGIYMLDAKYVLVEPLQDRLNDVLKPFRD